MDATKYNITVRKGIFSGEECYEARVLELPDVAEYADSFEDAYALAIDTLETTAKVFAEKAKTMPIPFEPADEFSGRVTLRMPKTMHRAYSRMAEIEDVSLNQLLVNCLSYALGAFNLKYQEYTDTQEKIIPLRKQSPVVKKVKPIQMGVPQPIDELQAYG
ncbi:MAG: toxin-antitoxin system HicB family antitoxin [Idiomarina sp.]